MFMRSYIFGIFVWSYSLVFLEKNYTFISSYTCQRVTYSWFYHLDSKLFTDTAIRIFAEQTTETIALIWRHCILCRLHDLLTATGIQNRRLWKALFSLFSNILLGNSSCLYLYISTIRTLSGLSILRAFSLHKCNIKWSLFRLLYCHYSITFCIRRI